MAPQITAHAMIKYFSIFALLFLTIHFSYAADSSIIPGTYSSLAYNKEGGDLTGYEVRIIPTNLGMKAVVQVAEGDAGRIYIVDVIDEAREISFDIPLASGMRGKFFGRWTSIGLEGIVVFPTGENEKVVLRRSISYWEK